MPDYLEIVTHPIDLGTIKKKLNGLEYSGHHDFLNDIQLMFSNCNKYNVVSNTNKPNSSERSSRKLSKLFYPKICPNELLNFALKLPVEMC